MDKRTPDEFIDLINEITELDAEQLVNYITDVKNTILNNKRTYLNKIDNDSFEKLLALASVGAFYTIQYKEVDGKFNK